MSLILKIFVINILILIGLDCLSQSNYDKRFRTYPKFNIHAGLATVSSVPLFHAGINYRFNKRISTDIELIGNGAFIPDVRIIGFNYHFRPNSGLMVGLICSHLWGGSENLYSISPNFGYLFYTPDFIPSIKISAGIGPAYFKSERRELIVPVINWDIAIGLNFINRIIKN